MPYDGTFISIEGTYESLTNDENELTLWLYVDPLATFPCTIYARISLSGSRRDGTEIVFRAKSNTQFEGTHPFPLFCVVSNVDFFLKQRCHSTTLFNRTQLDQRNFVRTIVKPFRGTVASRRVRGESL